MTIEWSISVGSIIIALSNVMVITLVAWRLTLRFTQMEKRVNLMFAWFLRQIKSDSLTQDEVRDFFGVERKD